MVGHENPKQFNAVTNLAARFVTGWSRRNGRRINALTHP